MLDILPLMRLQSKETIVAKVKVAGKVHEIKKNKKGDVIVDHAGDNDPKWDKINLTKKAGAKTVKEGIKATKDWHKKNPHIGKKGKK
jgi:hypothetical protein